MKTIDKMTLKDLFGPKSIGKDDARTLLFKDPAEYKRLRDLAVAAGLLR